MPVVQHVANFPRRRPVQPATVVRNALNQAPRVVQEYVEVGVAAGPRIQQEYAEIAIVGGPRVNQLYAELAQTAGPRVTQLYVEYADVAPFPTNELRPNRMVTEYELDVEVEVDTEDVEPDDPDPETVGDVPVVPPSPTVHMVRIIRDVPDPIIDSRGQPDEAWKSRSTWTEDVVDWGRLKLVIGGRDCTFERGISMVPLRWSKAEPFGDLAAEFRFPWLTPFEPIPDWLGDPANGEFRNVDLYQLKPPDPDNPTAKRVKDKIWEGLVVSYEESPDGLTVQCIGALYQLDLYLRRARVVEDTHPDDIVKILKDLVTPYGREKRTLRFRPLIVNPPNSVSGIEVLSHGDWNPLLTGYVSELLSLMWVEDGSTQWTIRKRTGRRPVLQLKDVNTEHYSIHLGEDGVDFDLRLDLTQAPTTIFGEGTDLDTCRWYNAKYPNLSSLQGAPVFFGTPIGPPPDSSHNDSMLLWEQEMHDRGWTSIVPDGVYSVDEEFWVREFQEQAGITVDGIIGPQTWAATFLNGQDAGDLLSPYIAPLHSKPKVDYYLRTPDGAKNGKNPRYDKNVLRVERYENFGSMITKREAMRSAKLEIQRDWPPGYFGTITLTVDPPEKSRFELEEGRNILVRGHRGVDRLLHISRVEVNWQSGAVTLTVDEKARDAMTLGAMLRRDREADDPARRRVVTRRNRSHDINDQKPVWDCENGAGLIPRLAVPAGDWVSIRIPAGKLGTVVSARLETTSPGVLSRMAWGIFDRPVTVNQLRAVGAPNPNAGNPLYFFDYWDQFGDELIIAWGAYDQPGGYSPGLASEDDPLTGVTEDAASWYFQSTKPPWLWIAIYVETGDENGINYVKGLLQPSNETS